MKKIISISIFAMFALLISSGAMAQTATSTKTTDALGAKKIDVVCIQNAIDKRDSSLASAVSVFGSSMRDAFSKRATDLKAAWSITTSKDRKVAVKSAWKAFASSKNQARVDYAKARKSAWSVYNNDRKACKISNVEDSMSGAVDNL